MASPLVPLCGWDSRFEQPERFRERPRSCCRDRRVGYRCGHDLTGGTGDFASNKVMVGGLQALPANEPGTNATAKWSGTGIVCTTQAVGTATDVIAVAVQSNARWTQQICGVAV